MNNIRSQIFIIVNSQNFKHGILYTIFSFVNSGISFILVLILARYLNPSEYGSLNLFTTFVTLINIIISLCTVSYVGVSFFKKDIEDLRKIVLIALVTTTGVLIILSLLLIAFPTYAEALIGIPHEYLWLGIMICYFLVFNNLNLDIWRLEEKPLSYGIYSVSFAIFNFCLTFWFIVGLHYGWTGRAYAWFMLALIYFIISIIFLIKRRYLVVCIPSRALIMETLCYALPLIPHSVSFWLKSGMDRYIINYYYDQTIVGYFSFAANLAAIITIIGTAFNSTNSVYIYKKLAYGYFKVKGILSKQSKLMTFLFFGVFIIVIFFAWGLVYFFLPKYRACIQYILPLCLGGFFQCLYLLWVNYLFFYNKTKNLMYITFSTAILQLFLSFWLTRYSVVYTAWISMGTTLLTYLIVYYQSKNELKQHNNEFY